MTPKHTNPTREDRKAHAPYNFVPLPEAIVTVDESEIPDQDVYEGQTGYIECVLTTETPMYTRSAMNPEFFRKWGDTSFDELPDEKKDERARFFNLDEAEHPVIPGSSLRGMIRTLVEITGYGQVKWVANEPKVTFRAVAASRDDPLRAPYDEALGRYGANVRVGYLVERENGWFIRPARHPSELGFSERNAYLKVKDRQIAPDKIPSFKRFDDPGYRPQFHPVSFEAEVRRGKHGKYTLVTQVSGDTSEHSYSGILVCSGNMLETADADQISPRQNYALVLERNDTSTLIRIPEQVVSDYISALTSFQKEEPFHPERGCLEDGRPVFFIVEDEQVMAFGHTPNFRIPAWLDGTRRAATPQDFVPETLTNQRSIDLAEAIFGRAADNVQSTRAGRIFFTDAKFETAQNGIWVSQSPITPKVLASPKPTTFQHYLVQDQNEGHDPDRKKWLAHYATLRDETAIRGHKLYWHKTEELNRKDFEADEKDIRHAPKQYTRIKPVNRGVQFRFRIYFENLRDHELGALLWTLQLPGNPDTEYRHKIGMGKPLGLGSVEIIPSLYLSDRTERYTRLFDKDDWHVREQHESDQQQFMQAFERYILDNMDQQERAGAQSLAQVKRIQMLLKMLEWPGPDADTSYMKLEDFEDRPVLPDPIQVAKTESSQPERHTGTVKWFSSEKGYGFIDIEGRTDEDAFVHYTEIKGQEGYLSLQEGDRVEFDIEEAEKGPRAIGVYVIN